MTAITPGSNFTMRKPEQWDILVEHATECTEDKNMDAQTRARQQYAETIQLDNEALEACRYYGIGVAMCELAQLFGDADLRAESLMWRRNHIVHNHQGYCLDSSLEAGKGIYIGELRPRAVGKSELIARRAAERLLLGVHLALETLSQVERQRQFERPVSKKTVDYGIEQIVRGDNTARDLSQFTVVASFLTRTALRNLHNKGVRVNREDVPGKFNPLLCEVVSHEDFKSLDLLQVAGFAAALRLDELGQVEGYLSADEEGTTTFDIEKVPVSPPPLPEHNVGNRILHAKRLRCPALYVNGMLKLALEFVKDVGIEADNEIRRYPPRRWL